MDALLRDHELVERLFSKPQMANHRDIIAEIATNAAMAGCMVSSFLVRAT
jgi:hypothetical protein